MAWLSGWSYRIKLFDFGVDQSHGYGYSASYRDYDLSRTPSNLTNFPWIVELWRATTVGLGALANGYDIRFTTADGVTLLDYDRRCYRANNIPGAGAYGIFVVRIPTVTVIRHPSTSSLILAYPDPIYMYYGKADAPDGSNPQGVYDDDYVAVLPMNAGGTFEDRSGAANSLTNLSTCSTQAWTDLPTFDLTINDIISATWSRDVTPARTWQGVVGYGTGNLLGQRNLALDADALTIEAWVRWTYAGPNIGAGANLLTIGPPGAAGGYVCNLEIGIPTTYSGGGVVAAAVGFTAHFKNANGVEATAVYNNGNAYWAADLRRGANSAGMAGCGDLTYPKHFVGAVCDQVAGHIRLMFDNEVGHVAYGGGTSIEYPLTAPFTAARLVSATGPLSVPGVAAPGFVGATQSSSSPLCEVRLSKAARSKDWMGIVSGAVTQLYQGYTSHYPEEPFSGGSGPSYPSVQTCTISMPAPTVDVVQAPSVELSTLTATVRLPDMAGGPSRGASFVTPPTSLYISMPPPTLSLGRNALNSVSRLTATVSQPAPTIEAKRKREVTIAAPASLAVTARSPTIEAKRPATISLATLTLAVTAQTAVCDTIALDGWDEDDDVYHRVET